MSIRFTIAGPSRSFPDDAPELAGDGHVFAGADAGQAYAAATIEGAFSGVIDIQGSATSALTVTNAGTIKGDGYDGVTQHGKGAIPRRTMRGPWGSRGSGWAARRRVC